MYVCKLQKEVRKMKERKGKVRQKKVKEKDETCSETSSFIVRNFATRSAKHAKK
jgi:hypothetical protein